MKPMKRICSAVLAAVMILSSAVVSVAATPSGISLSLVPESEQIILNPSGDTEFTVDVVLTDTKGHSGGVITVRWPEENFTLTGITNEKGHFTVTPVTTELSAANERGEMSVFYDGSSVKNKTADKAKVFTLCFTVLEGTEAGTYAMGFVNEMESLHLLDAGANLMRGGDDRPDSAEGAYIKLIDESETPEENDIPKNLKLGLLQNGIIEISFDHDEGFDNAEIIVCDISVDGTDITKRYPFNKSRFTIDSDRIYEDSIIVSRYPTAEHNKVTVKAAFLPEGADYLKVNQWAEARFSCDVPPVTLNDPEIVYQGNGVFTVTVPDQEDNIIGYEIEILNAEDRLVLYSDSMMCRGALNFDCTSKLMKVEDYDPEKEYILRARTFANLNNFAHNETWTESEPGKYGQETRPEGVVYVTYCSKALVYKDIVDRGCDYTVRDVFAMGRNSIFSALNGSIEYPVGGIITNLSRDLLLDYVETEHDGWHNDDAKGWRYRDPNGLDVVNDWRTGEKAEYYLGPDGYMLTDSFVEYDGNTYYVGGDGAKVKNTVLTIEKYAYTFDEYGVLKLKDPLDVEAFINRLYKECLGREADQEGFAYWIGELKAGKCTGAKAAGGFIISDEVIYKNLCDECYMKLLYRAIMGREADEAGLSFWTGMLADGYGRGAALDGFIQSAEFQYLCNMYGIEIGTETFSDKDFRAHGECKICGKDDTPEFIIRLYRECFDREPDEDGFAYWLGELKAGRCTGAKAAGGFIISDEVKYKNLCDECYMKLLYRAIMGREADNSGLMYWKEKLASGCTRGEALDGFVQSAEFYYLCDSYGIEIGTETFSDKDFKSQGTCSECGK